MGSQALKRLGHDALRWARHLTWPWLAFAAMLAGGIGFYVAVVMPARHALTEIRQHAAAVQRDHAGLQQAAMEAARKAPAGQLEAFDARFPAEQTAPDTLELILATAEKNGLTPKQAEYRVIRNNPGQLLSYQLTVPLKGSYPRVLAFVSAVLPKVQNLALENMAFQRQKIGDEQVDATLMFTLYLRRES